MLEPLAISKKCVSHCSPLPQPSSPSPGPTHSTVTVALGACVCVCVCAVISSLPLTAQAENTLICGLQVRFE